MNRALLCSAMEGVVSRYGYEFFLNDKSYYPTTVYRYPAAFMSYPEFIAMEGQKHGRITYEISLRLACQGAKLSASERNAILSEMEKTAVDMFVALSKEDHIAVVKDLTISPCAEAIDEHGAITIEATTKVETIF